MYSFWCDFANCYFAGITVCLPERDERESTIGMLGNLAAEHLDQFRAIRKTSDPPQSCMEYVISPYPR